jgi:hypothetical protein
MREKNALDRLDKYQEQMHHSTRERIALERQREQAFKENDELKLKHQELLQKLTLLEQDARTRMSKQRADDLVEANDRLHTELVETRAAMNTYKGLTETLAEQAKGLKLMVERNKDENENLLTAVRELQA